MSDLENKGILQKLIRVGLPIAMQNLVATALNLVDNVMIGSRGEIALTAVTLSNRVFFILAITLYGVYSGMSIYTSQYWGKKDMVNIRKVMGMAMSLGFLLSFSVSILTQAFPRQIVGLFIDDPEVLAQGTDYLRIAALSYVPMAITFMFSFTSRSVHRAKIPMMTSIIALSTNTFINYLLINGNLGFPELGVKGAAIATVISRILEMILLLSIIYLAKDHPLAAKLKEMFSYGFPMFRKVFRTVLPVIINESAWSIGVSVYYVAYGFLGTASVAALQVSLTISDLFWAFLIGIGNATAVLVGNQLGAENIQKAYHTARRLIVISLYISVFLAVFYLLAGNSMASLFRLSPDSMEIARMCIIVNAFYMPVKMLAFIFIVGIFRSGGDTRFCMLLDIGAIWVVGVPLAFLCVLVFKLPVYWCLAIVFSEEILKVVISFFRFKNRKWINVLTVKGEADV
ncbi:MAG: MATE family efflux transporter [Clostridia bacterium]